MAANNDGDPDNKIIRPNSNDRDCHVLTFNTRGEAITRILFDFTMVLILKSLLSMQVPLNVLISQKARKSHL